MRNPLQVLPQAAYEEDFVPLAGAESKRVWVTGPALVKAVLLDQRESFGKLTQIRLLGPMLGKGILTSEGAHWKWQRQAAAPIFRPQELGSFVPAFVYAAQDLLEGWRRQPQGCVRRIDHEMTRATFDVVRATLLRSAVAAMLSERRKALDDGEPRDLMHRLIAARDPETGQAMSDEQLVDNLFTFYLAGHETTAKALTWTLYLLARSPERTAALKEEIARVTGGAAISGERIDRLVLVQQVIKEAMRLYPPVPMMSRQAVADTRIGDHRVRAGTSLLIPIYVVHRRKKRWDDPDAFDPTRFAPTRRPRSPATSTCRSEPVRASASAWPSR